MSAPEKTDAPDKAALQLAADNANVVPFRGVPGWLLRALPSDRWGSLSELARAEIAGFIRGIASGEGAGTDRKAVAPQGGNQARPTLTPDRVVLTGPKVLRLFVDDRPAVQQTGRRGRYPRNVVRITSVSRFKPGDAAMIWWPAFPEDHGMKVRLIKFHRQGGDEWWDVECPFGIEPWSEAKLRRCPA